MLPLQIESPCGSSTPCRLPPGRHSIGGGARDRLRVAGAPEAAACVDIGCEAAILVASVPGIHLGDRALCVGERRLVRPGEVLRVGGTSIRFLPDLAPGPEATAGRALRLIAAELGMRGEPTVPCLVWLNGKDCGKRLPLNPGATFLGRGEGALARIRDPLASKAHARLTLSAEGACLADLSSTNGLFVNGAPVRGTRALAGGDVLRIGDTELAYQAPRLAAPVTSEPARPPEAQRPTPRARPRHGSRAAELAVVAVASSGALTALGAALWLAVR